MKYLVVYEKSPTSWGAYVPDLPGLGVAGKTLDKVKELIREAIEFHLEGMRKHGDEIPLPSATTEYVTIWQLAGIRFSGPRKGFEGSAPVFVFASLDTQKAKAPIVSRGRQYLAQDAACHFL